MPKSPPRQRAAVGVDTAGRPANLQPRTLDENRRARFDGLTSVTSSPGHHGNASGRKPLEIVLVATSIALVNGQHDVALRDADRFRG